MMIRILGLVAFLAAWPAWAGLPDPVALGVALEAGDIHAARRWLDEGLDPNQEADRIGTGLMIGAWEGNIALMELFHARGADLARSNRFGEQALQLAAWRGHLEAVRWLLERGAPVNRSGKAWAALHYAVFAGRGEIARLLMARGADINARTPNESTPLMMAALEGQEDLAQLLIGAGADPRLANDRGDTALSWAMRHGNLRIAKLVASSEEFARAVKAPPESFASARKSVAAPSEITELLQKLRLAEARGQETADLRRALMAAVARFKAQSTVTDLKGKKRSPVGQRPTLVITAERRPGGGERVELVAGDGAKATPAQQGASYDQANVDDFAGLVQQLNRAEAEGRPTAGLRRAVREALAKMRTTPPPGPAPGQP